MASNLLPGDLGLPAQNRNEASSKSETGVQKERSRHWGVVNAHFQIIFYTLLLTVVLTGHGSWLRAVIPRDGESGLRDSDCVESLRTLWGTHSILCSSVGTVQA